MVGGGPPPPFTITQGPHSPLPISLLVYYCLRFYYHHCHLHPPPPYPYHLTSLSLSLASTSFSSFSYCSFSCSSSSRICSSSSGPTHTSPCRIHLAGIASCQKETITLPKLLLRSDHLIHIYNAGGEADALVKDHIIFIFHRSGRCRTKSRGPERCNTEDTANPGGGSSHMTVTFQINGTIHHQLVIGYK